MSALIFHLPVLTSSSFTHPSLHSFTSPQVVFKSDTEIEVSLASPAAIPDLHSEQVCTGNSNVVLEHIQDLKDIAPVDVCPSVVTWNC